MYGALDVVATDDHRRTGGPTPAAETGSLVI